MLVLETDKGCCRAASKGPAPAKFSASRASSKRASKPMERRNARTQWTASTVAPYLLWTGKRNVRAKGQLWVWTLSIFKKVKQNTKESEEFKKMSIFEEECQQHGLALGVGTKSPASEQHFFTRQSFSIGGFLRDVSLSSPSISHKGNCPEHVEAAYVCIIVFWCVFAQMNAFQASLVYKKADAGEAFVFRQPHTRGLALQLTSSGFVGGLMELGKSAPSLSIEVS